MTMKGAATEARHYAKRQCSASSNDAFAGIQSRLPSYSLLMPIPSRAGNKHLQKNYVRQARVNAHAGLLIECYEDCPHVQKDEKGELP